MGAQEGQQAAQKIARGEHEEHIAEQGTGPELLAAGGSYARLYQAAGHHTAVKKES